MFDDVLAADGTILGFLSTNYGATTNTAAESRDYFVDYGFTPAYYVGGPPPFAFPFFPFIAVVDLNTGVLVKAFRVGDDYANPSAVIDEALGYVEAADID